MSTETQQQRFIRITSQPDIMEVIYDHIAAGGSVIDFVVASELKYGPFARWLFNDEARFKVYTAALEAREKYVLEESEAELHKYNKQKASDSEGSELKHSSKLKAIDMLFKKHGQYVDKKEISGTLKLDELIGGSWPKKPDGAT